MLKPSKPTPDFPLFPHATGRWAKKIAGKMHYFGPWDKPSEALANYQALASGSKPIKKAKEKERVNKPRADFPLSVHPTGRWCKRVRGTLHYFGSTSDDPNGEAALQLWLDQRDDLLAGRSAKRPDSKRLTIYELTQRFLAFKERAMEAGEIGSRTFGEYRETAKLVEEQLGGTFVDDLKSTHFEALRGYMASKWGPVRLGNQIQRVRMIFNYAAESGLIDRPIVFGPGFEKPSAKVLRLARAKAGRREFTAEELAKLLSEASVNMKAMLLLGVNGGLGNLDLALLKTKSLNLRSAWLDYPRNKTGIERRIPLWPETLEALKAVVSSRRKPREESNADYLFITPQGLPYWLDDPNYGLRAYSLSAEFIRLTKKCGLEDRNFYDLRRTFQTVAEGCRDLVAVQAIMGHAPSGGDMSSIYRQRVDDSRLQAAVDAVRNWLFADGGKKTLKSA